MARFRVPAVAIAVALGVVITVLAVLVATHARNPTSSSSSSLPPGGDWSTYLGNESRDGTPVGEQLISDRNASSLEQLWSFKDQGSLQSEPVVAGTTVYVGDAGGDENAINAQTGALLWQSFIGVDNQDTACGKTPLGVISTPTVTAQQVLLYGGDSKFYALNRTTGAVVWSTPVGNITDGYFGWGSPLVSHGSIYVGIASRCDHPLVPAGLAQISMANHSVVAVFHTTSPGLLGNSVWSTPALNASSNTIFVTTGNPNGTDPRGLSEAILAVNASTLQLERFWQVPVNQTQVDSDFGSTPVLFTPRGAPAMVAGINKNGILYAWYQSNLTLAWERTISWAPTISSASWSGHSLYVTGSNTTIAGQSYGSGVFDLNPRNGSVLWQRGFAVPHTGYTSPLWVNGALVVADASTTQILNASTGTTITSLPVNGSVNAPPAISRGTLYVATTHGRLYAFDLDLPRDPPTVQPTASGLALPGLLLAPGALVRLGTAPLDPTASRFVVRFPGPAVKNGALPTRPSR
jgi:polyvinyl alcohol dehydrogenase (cytochrome)